MGMRATRFHCQPDTAITGLAAQRPAKAFRSPPNVAFAPLLGDPPELWRSKQQPATATLTPPLRVKLAFSRLSI